MCIQSHTTMTLVFCSCCYNFVADYQFRPVHFTIAWLVKKSKYTSRGKKILWQVWFLSWLGGSVARDTRCVQWIDGHGSWPCEESLPPRRIDSAMRDWPPINMSSEISLSTSARRIIIISLICFYRTLNFQLICKYSPINLLPLPIWICSESSWVALHFPMAAKRARDGLSDSHKIITPSLLCCVNIVGVS